MARARASGGSRLFGLGALIAVFLFCAAIAAPPASAHNLPKSFARQNTDTLMKRICHEDERPCRGWGVKQCARKSDHRVDCYALHRFVENDVNKTCRMWSKSLLRGNLVTTSIRRATVKCRPD